VNTVAVAIIGAGPYGLSLAAHLRARKIEHRIFGRPMRFWADIAAAGGERYLKSYCFGTNISAPAPGYSFADYNGPRGLETFEPCSIENFVAYGNWFQQSNVPWVETVNVESVEQRASGFALKLGDGERCIADRVVIATGLTGFSYVPPELALLPKPLVTHTSEVASFAAHKGRDVAVIGAGQSALEAAALLQEAGAQPQLLVRGNSILWQTRIPLKRSFWRRLRSPISKLGTGPKAWALTRFPGAMHRVPETWRIRFVRSHLPPEGAWWLRDRVENKMPISLGARLVAAHEAAGRVTLDLSLATEGCKRRVTVDHVIAGSGYKIDVDRLHFIHPKLRAAIRRCEGAPRGAPSGAPRLNAAFETSVPGLYFIGPASAMSFGPLFRFVVGAEYSVRVISARLAAKA
jgi:FAD-dependent urate hydroxylase